MSGAERLVLRKAVTEDVLRMVDRALARAGRPDEIVVTVEPVSPSQVRRIRSLDMAVLRTDSASLCRELALQRLQECGVSLSAARLAIDLLDKGPSRCGGVMRGAVIMDADSGVRREEDQDRGLRVSRVDWSSEAAVKIRRSLTSLGLTHVRTQEALALASKAARAPGMIAELCWSDDPDYIAGYVADIRRGYLRLPVMKRRGNPLGGRVFFVQSGTYEPEAFTFYLQQVPVLITSPGAVRNLDPRSLDAQHE